MSSNSKSSTTARPFHFRGRASRSRVMSGARQRGLQCAGPAVQGEVQQRSDPAHDPLLRRRHARGRARAQSGPLQPARADQRLWVQRRRRRLPVPRRRNERTGPCGDGNRQQRRDRDQPRAAQFCGGLAVRIEHPGPTRAPGFLCRQRTDRSSPQTLYSESAAYLLFDDTQRSQAPRNRRASSPRLRVRGRCR